MKAEIKKDSNSEYVYSTTDKPISHIYSSPKTKPKFNDRVKPRAKFNGYLDIAHSILDKNYPVLISYGLDSMNILNSKHTDTLQTILDEYGLQVLLSTDTNDNLRLTTLILK